jgi:hypothetical protein
MLSHKSIVTLRRILLGFACVITILALFIVEENWRGDRAWAAYQQEMRAKGEPLEFKSFDRPAIPDNQNFFKTPLLSRLLYERPEDAEREKLMKETRLLKLPFGSVRSRRDLTAFLTEGEKMGLLPAASSDSAGLDALSAMHTLQPLLDEIRDAARTRPLASLAPRADPITENIAAGDVFKLGQAMAVRAFAEIEVGRTDDAFADVIAMQRLANALSNKPETLLNLLIGVAIHGLAAAVISDGCKEHIWTDSALEDFQKNFGEFKPLLGFRDAIRTERSLVVYVIDRHPIKEFPDAELPFWLFHGWLQQNKITYCRELETSVLSAFTLEPPRVYLDKPPSNASAPSKFYSPFRWLSRLAIANLDGILGGLAKTVDELTLTYAACAMEQYRLVNGRYPATLDELAPNFLQAVPSGVVDGQSARYSRPAEGSFKLWFAGPNGSDDGGKGDDITSPETSS